MDEDETKRIALQLVDKIIPLFNGHNLFTVSLTLDSVLLFFLSIFIKEKISSIAELDELTESLLELRGTFKEGLNELLKGYREKNGQ